MHSKIAHACQIFIPWQISSEKTIFTVLEIRNSTFSEKQTSKFNLCVSLEVEAKPRTTMSPYKINSLTDTLYFYQILVWTRTTSLCILRLFYVK